MIVEIKKMMPMHHIDIHYKDIMELLIYYLYILPLYVGH